MVKIDHQFQTMRTTLITLLLLALFISGCGPLAEPLSPGADDQGGREQPNRPEEIIVPGITRDIEERDSQSGGEGQFPEAQGEESQELQVLSPEEALQADALNYAEAFGISLDEALARFAVQEAAGELQVQVREAAADTFGGMWLEHEPEFKLVLAFTRDGEATLRPFLEGKPWSDLVEVRQVDRTEAELLAIQDEATDILFNLGLFFNSGSNIVENQVELWVTNVEDTLAALEAAGETLPDGVVLIETAGLAVPEPGG